MPSNSAPASTGLRSVFGDVWQKVKGQLVGTLIVALVALNVLSLVSSLVHDIAFGVVNAVLMSAIPEAMASRLLRDSPTVKRKSDIANATKAVNDEKAAIAASRKALEIKHASLEKSHADLTRTSAAKTAATQRISKRMATRAVANASRNLSAIFAESVPYLGAAVVLTVTALDIQDACESLKDVNALNAAYALEPQDQATVCGQKVPTLDDVKDSLEIRWLAEH